MKFKIQTIILVLFCGIAFALPHSTSAQIPFGGPILMSYECACSGGWLIVMYDQMTHLPVPMVFQFGISMLRANYNIFTPTVQTLGSYTPGGICLLASLDCAGTVVQGTVTPYLPIPFPGIGTGAI